MPEAARLTDLHTCPASTGPTPHVGGPIEPGDPCTVFIGGLPAARTGDPAACEGPPDSIANGEPTVQICKRPAARLGDEMAHGGRVVIGCPSVVIGSTNQATAIAGAVKAGFVDWCDPNKKGASV
jgi:uncharacterized Zn-binding protein involved in type VI secretion